MTGPRPETFQTTETYMPGDDTYRTQSATVQSAYPEFPHRPRGAVGTSESPLTAAPKRSPSRPMSA